MPVEVELTGHLDLDLFRAKVDPVREVVATRRRLLFDCRGMTGYDPEARQAFIDWHKSHPEIDRVAVVTENRLWHVVIAAMALASGKRMRAFSDVESARKWAGSG